MAKAVAEAEEQAVEAMDLDDHAQAELKQAHADFEAKIASKIKKRPDEGDEAYALRTKRAKHTVIQGDLVRSKAKA